VTVDPEISGLLGDRRRGSPSPSASDINQRILELLHERGSLSAGALAEAIHEAIEHVNGRLNALTRLGLLQASKDGEGLAIYSLSSTGARAHGLAYLSIHRT
jgi:predicted ArsR family transcriptional regulator